LSTQLSVIVITKNEEANIADCLESVRWADEIIVVDSQSTDKTIEVAKKYAGKIFIIKWNGFSAAKNYAIEQAKNGWIFSIDADERVTPELAEEIQEIVKNQVSSSNAYEVGRKAYFLGKWIRHCGWYPSYVVRLFRSGSGRYNVSRVHEKFDASGKIERLKHDLTHLTDNDLHHYFSKYNIYTSLAAQDLSDNKRRFTITDIIFKPMFTFLKMYVLRLGFLDGIHGFILCSLSASYVFTKYAKLWEINVNNKMKNNRK
jgi:glycosyltransferase involved in cell wall biosynthesis